MSAVTAIRVLYGVTAVYTKVKAVQTLDVRLETSDAGLLERAESLVVAVIQLNRQRLADEARASYEDGDYGAVVELKNVGLVRGTGPEDDTRLLLLRAELELKASRALGEDEGVADRAHTDAGKACRPRQAHRRPYRRGGVDHEPHKGRPDTGSRPARGATRLPLGEGPRPSTRPETSFGSR